MTLTQLENRILEALAATDQTPGMFMMPFWMASNLDDAAFDALEKLERVVGEDSANQWLADVMVKSGKYVPERGGYVRPKNLGERAVDSISKGIESGDFSDCEELIKELD